MRTRKPADSFEAAPALKPLVGDDTDAGLDGSTVPPGAQLSANPTAGAVQNNDSAQSVPTKVLTGDIDPAESPKFRRLGDFELLRVIGRGGMGIVYEAQQLSLRRRVALKLLPLISVLDARQIARFKNEAQAAANLQHPNIVPVYAVGNYQGVHYYAMRFIDGHPLDAIVAALRHKKQTLVQSRSIAHENTVTGKDASDMAPDLSAAEQWSVPPAFKLWCESAFKPPVR